MSNVFIPYTPYNVLLSLAVAAGRPDDDNFMILVGKDHNFIESSMTLMKIFHSVGMRYFAFDRCWDDSNVKNFFLKKRNLKALERELAALPSIERLYYVREWNVYTTCAVDAARRLNPETEFHFMEDGVYTYVETEKELKNRVERLADRLVYGSWHVSVGVPGALCPDAVVSAAFPEFLPGIYDGRRFERIELAPLAAMADENILASETGTSGAERIDALVALAGVGDGEYKKLARSFIERNRKLKYATAVKRHPNDAGSLDPALGGPGVAELEPRVPVELFYFRYHNTLKRVAGGLSTALLTARMLLPEAEIESVVSEKYLACDEHSEKILALFKRAGINVTVIKE